MKKLNLQSGFTLIELMVYFAITSLFLFAISSFALRIIDASRLSENVNEIQASSNFSADMLIEKIHMASSVDSGNSILDNDIGKLALNGTTNVTFYLENESLYFKEGSSSPIKLNSDATKVKKFRVHTISSPKTPMEIIIDSEFFAMTNISNLAHTYPFHLSVSLRK